METKVISARVPAKFADNLNAYCKQKGISVSAYLQQGFADPECPERGANFSKIDVTPEFANVLKTVAGGSVIGLAVYKATKWALQDKDEANKIEMYAMAAGIAAGLVGLYGFHKLINK